MTRSKSKRERRVDFWARVIGVLIVMFIIGGLIGLRSALPCKYIDWMPAKDVPARCLTVGPQR